jgi:hypothetical protein
MIADLQARLDAALAENERLKETNARLNRRCQCYERGLAEKVKNSRGRSIGRAVAVAAFLKSEAENERLRAVAEAAKCLNHREVAIVLRQNAYVITAGLIEELAAALDALKEPGDG